jgi:hypothetical protein
MTTRQAVLSLLLALCACNGDDGTARKGRLDRRL